MATQEERTENTQALLIEAFRQSLIDHGVTATTIQSVLSRVGLSKGAMYHHFETKQDIIAAVYDFESLQAIERAQASVAGEGKSLNQLMDFISAWMQEVRDLEVSKILFEVGPAALGINKVREIENSHSLKLIEAYLLSAVEEGEIEPQNTELTGLMLNALIGEAVLYRLRSGEETASALEQTLSHIFSGMRTVNP